MKKECAYGSSSQNFFRCDAFKKAYETLRRTRQHPKIWFAVLQDKCDPQSTQITVLMLPRFWIGLSSLIVKLRSSRFVTHLSCFRPTYN